MSYIGGRRQDHWGSDNLCVVSAIFQFFFDAWFGCIHASESRVNLPLMIEIGWVFFLAWLKTFGVKIKSYRIHVAWRGSQSYAFLIKCIREVGCFPNINFYCVQFSIQGSLGTEIRMSDFYFTSHEQVHWTKPKIKPGHRQFRNKTIPRWLDIIWKYLYGLLHVKGNTCDLYCGCGNVAVCLL